MRNSIALFPNPERRAVDSAIDGAYGFPLRSAIFFPVSLMPKKDIVVSSRQPMRTPFWPDLEGEAMIFEHFPGCDGGAISPPLICRSWVSGEPVIPPPANSGDRLFAISIKLDDYRSDAP